MKTLDKILKRWPMAVLGVMVLSSCLHDPDFVQPNNGPGGETVRFYVDVPGTNSMETRGTVGSVNENKINNITLLVFDKDTGELLHKIAGTGLTAASGAVKGNKWQFSATGMNAGTYDLMALANATDFLGSVTPGPSVTKTTVAQSLYMDAIGDLIVEMNAILEELYALYGDEMYYWPSEAWDRYYEEIIPREEEIANAGRLKISADNMPMWGQLDGCVIANGVTPEFKMLRMAAKINVTLGMFVNNFELTSVRYCNWSKRGYLIPEAGNYTTAEDGTVTVTGPSLRGNEVTDEYLKRIIKYNPVYYDNSYITNKRSCVDQIYVLEAPFVDDFPANDVWWEEEENTGWQSNPFIVIGGIFDPASGNTTETFYRVDFIKKDNGDEWMSVLRNHSYNVVINEVKHAGHLFPESAYKSAPVNMDCSTYVLGGSDIEGVVVFGPYYVAVSHMKLHYPATIEDANSTELTRTFRYESNWPYYKRGQVEYYTLLGGSGGTDDWDCVKTYYRGGESDYFDPQEYDMAVTSKGGSGKTGGIHYYTTMDDYYDGANPLELTVKFERDAILPMFARSNVVLMPDGTLSFAVTEEDNETIPANTMGLHFKKGSLVGMAVDSYPESYQPYGSIVAWDASHIRFAPPGLSFSADYADIPSMSGDFLETYPRNFSGRVEYRGGYDETTGKGDICRYISDKNWVKGRWRMPTIYDWLLLNGETFEENPTVYASQIIFDNTYPPGCTPLEAGCWIGHNYVWASLIEQELTDEIISVPSEGSGFLPASGCFQENGSFALTKDKSYFYQLYNIKAGSTSVQEGRPVRCIRDNRDDPEVKNWKF